MTYAHGLVMFDLRFETEDAQMDKDEYAFAQVTDLLLQAESCMARARAAAYFLRGTPAEGSRLHSEMAEIEASIARFREAFG